LPTFTYEVTATVTDLNGETHNTTGMVSVGYHALTANMEVAELIDKTEKDHKIKISTHNLNGQFVPAEGTLRIYKLSAPGYTLRPRPWPAPDYDGFGKSKFKELFPHDAYGKENDPATWEKGKLVWNSAFDTEKSKEIALGALKKWKSGKYILELETKDRFGQTVRDIQQTTLYSDSDKQLADHQLFQIKTDKPSYQIGDNVQLSLLSSAKDITVTLFIEKNAKVVATHKVRLHNNSKVITIPVTADDLGGFAINYSFSAYNSFQSGNRSIPVPYPPTDLQIETVTFRDKLRPGTDETWSFRIKGPKGEQVTAELLASMYDASLDAFRGHDWNFAPLQKGKYYSNTYLNAYRSYGTARFNTYLDFKGGSDYTPQGYDSFDWFGLHFGNRYAHMTRMMMKKEGAPAEFMEVADIAVEESAFEGFPSRITGNSAQESTETDSETGFDDIQIRKNLQETAFFFPQLLTDEAGNVSFSFTTPEALTKWKLQLLAHTKTLESRTTTLETVTQKELMVIPNAPRFLREGDQIVISSKIANLTEKGLSGKARLELTDALSGKLITDELLSPKTSSGNLAKTDFNMDAQGNTEVSWTLRIPEGLQAVQFKVMAKAGDFSDGEQNVLPVLTNRILVTETLPMWVRGNETKTFTLDKLLKNRSTSLKNHQLSLEITSNPAWYAVQALPYLMEYPYDCNEQIFARYYANSLGAYIAHSNPRIREVFDRWANSDALLGNLEKNQELKSILIQETPWLRDAQSETEQKKRIALLFDLNKLRNDQAGTLKQLQENQMSSGAWAWFKGGRENRFITQHIVAGFGHLVKLTTTPSKDQQMIQKAISYLDDAFVKEYEEMKKHTTDINKDNLSYTQLHYLYTRSFFQGIKTSKK
ncbi:MAG TPA: alpha-2-macroglobulin family protein, partial [Arenibacter sp.]|nr:alpha-2-macroglobulin family protein [Arenibacter sp.]